MSRFLLLAILAGQGEPTDGELIRAIIDNTEPLEAPRGERLPLYVWPAHALGTTDEDELVEILTALEARGMAAIASWKPNDAGALEDALRLARLQERLGLPISVSATSSTYGFSTATHKPRMSTPTAIPSSTSRFRPSAGWVARSRSTIASQRCARESLRQ
jgi:hypothetical protein